MIITFFKNFFKDLFRQPLRTFLTLSGVVWGTMTIVLLLAFGEGLRIQIIKNMHGMGQGILIVWPGRTSIAYKGIGKGRRIRVTPSNLEKIREKMVEVEYLSPEFNERKRVSYKKVDMLNFVSGVNVEYEQMRNIIPQKGRFLDEIDIKEKRRVCFLGNKVAKNLFKQENPIGKNILIDGFQFLVVGVLINKVQNSTYNGRDEDRVFIPYTTYMSIFGNKYVDNFVLKFRHPEYSKQYIKVFRKYMGKFLYFSPDDEEALWVWDTSDIDKFFKVFFLAFNLFLGFIGGFTLLVGGIGVASIMMVVVEERTKEIGIKIAVGAKRKFIMKQFFFESLIIIIIGGIIGFSFSEIIVSSIPFDSVKDYIGIPQINIVVGILTIIVLLIVGTLSSLKPARKAVEVNPIEALRS